MNTTDLDIQRHISTFRCLFHYV